MPRTAWTVLCLALVLSAPLAATASARDSSWVELDQGRVDGFFWALEAKRQDGARAGRLGAWRPCLQVVTKQSNGPFNYNRSRYRTCAPEPGNLAAGDAPLIASGMHASGPRRDERSFVGMISAPAVHWVRITLAGGRTRTVGLNRLAPSSTRLSGVGRLRYAGFMVHGIWCAERIVTLSASRRALWDSGTDAYECPGTG